MTDAAVTFFVMFPTSGCGGSLLVALKKTVALRKVKHGIILHQDGCNLKMAVASRGHGSLRMAVACLRMAVACGWL